MTKQEIKELQGKPIPELLKVGQEHRERLRNLQLDLAAGKVKNEVELRAVRKDIARIETAMSFARIAERKTSAKQ